MIKLLQLLYDLLNNDDSILGHGYRERDELSAQEKLIDKLLEYFKDADLSLGMDYQVRDYCLSCLYRLYFRRVKSLHSKIRKTLRPHRKALVAMQNDPQRGGQIETEIASVDRVWNVPNEKSQSINFPDIKPVYIHTWENGSRNEGELDKQGNREGNSIWTTCDGSTYVGQYKDGKRDGKGTYTCADGSKYEGDW